MVSMEAIKAVAVGDRVLNGKNMHAGIISKIVPGWGLQVWDVNGENRKLKNGDLENLSYTKARWPWRDILDTKVKIKARPEGLKDVMLGTRVVNKITLQTGEVFKINEESGVEVWIEDGNRQNWWWGVIAVRRPRLIKRFPRPFRFARLVPTLQCHCRLGRLEIVKLPDKVRCMRCSFLIGNESFPNRIDRASSLLMKKASFNLRRIIQGGKKKEEKKSKQKPAKSLKGRSQGRLVKAKVKKTNRVSKKVSKKILTKKKV